MTVSKKPLPSILLFLISNKFHRTSAKNTAKGIVTSSQYSLHLSQHSSFNFNSSEYCEPVKVALLPLQQIAHGILQDLLICTMVSSQAV